MSRRVPPPPPLSPQRRSAGHYTLPPPPPFTVGSSRQESSSEAPSLSCSRKELYFVKDPPEEIVIDCPICLSVMLASSLLTSCCGHHFCSSCISRVKGSCPHCRAKSYQTMPNKDRLRIIRGLKVYCSNNEAGCSWKGELKDLSVHIRRGCREGECQYEIVECRYRQCNVKKKRIELDEHEIHDCIHKPQHCQYCGALYHQAVSSEHYELCKKYPMPCPNNCSSQTLPRENLMSHLMECLLEPVDCELSWAGCSDRPLRKDVKEHMVDNLSGHFSLLAVACGGLKEENKVLREEINALKGTWNSDT